MTGADLVLRGIGQLVTMEPGPGDEPDDRVGARRGAALAARDGDIVWIGDDAEVDSALALEPDARVHDAAGGVVLPGLVDPHTHLVFAGSRHHEFALRLAGADYLEILASGGGILNTVRETRAATKDELIAGAAKRLATLLAFGVTTCEIKSGYGLETATEIRMLEVVRALQAVQPVRLVPSFLGAHVFPEEYKDRHDAYVDLICEEMIPEVASRGLAKMCDVFLDRGVFEPDQAERILTAGMERGLRPRLHAGQFSDLGGPELAARLRAASADHMEHFSDEGIRAMAARGVVACLLPGAALSLGMRFPNGRRLRDAGVEVALATDCNPGTSRTENLPLMATLAATAMGLSVEDALRGITIVAAKALELEGSVGSLAVGKRADLVLFDVPHYRSLAYHFGVNHARRVYIGGEVAYESSPPPPGAG